MKIVAVIFDLDGTVLLSEEAYEQAFRKVLEENGVKKIPRHPQTSGIGVKENWVVLKEKYKLAPSVEQLTSVCQDEYLARLDKVAIRDGFFKIVGDLKDSGILVALATSNAWWLVEEVVRHFGIGQYFDSITTTEDVNEPKPEPDIFLETAAKLGVEPGECLVIEDTPAGVAAAKSAGMKAIALTSSYAKEDDLKEADIVVSGFEKITPQLISRL